MMSHRLKPPDGVPEMSQAQKEAAVRFKWRYRRQYITGYWYPKPDRTLHLTIEPREDKPYAHPTEWEGTPIDKMIRVTSDRPHLQA